jgi:TolB-like protein/DNA-binding winged helix-turn-helix (wHTH) protein/Flp pilus assembly protein TadD
MSKIQRELYKFGPFIIDAVERIVTRDGSPLSITPKVFDTLLYLLRNRGRTLTKDELLKNIWPGTFVEEVNLAVNISNLRKLLGDNPQDPQYVVTLSGRGYRFIAEVRADVETDDVDVRQMGIVSNEQPDVHQLEDAIPQSENAVTSQVREGTTGTVQAGRSLIYSKWRIPLSIVLLVLAATGIYFWRGAERRKSISEADASIAVLAFVDLSQEKDQEYFSDGLTDELTEDLTKIPGLRVIARSSAFQFKGKNEDLRVVGRKLGVANILEGSVRRDGERIRITAELTKVSDGFQFWSETYDRKTDDLLATQEEIAHAVAGALQVRILDPNHGPDSPHLRNPAAYEPYLKAQYYFARGEEKEDLDKALNNVDQAIQMDDTFAAAWALRSSVINTAASIGLRKHEDGYREALKDAEKAIALDKNLASGYVALAWVKINFEWDWDGAESALRKAGMLQPGSAVVLSYRAYLYQCTGRLDEAIALTGEASTLDPLRTSAYLGDLLYVAGRYDEARSALDKAVTANPKIEGLHARLALILLAQGRAQDALAEIDLEPGEWEKLTAEALVYHALKRTAESDKALAILISRHPEDAPYQIAEVYAYRGETNHAIEWLERAYRQRDPGLNQLKLDPLLRNVLSDERYLDLLKKMGLSTKRP